MIIIITIPVIFTNYVLQQEMISGLRNDFVVKINDIDGGDDDDDDDDDYNDFENALL